MVDLRLYLEKEENGEQREDLIATWSDGVMNHDTADLEMMEVIEQSKYKKNAVHHLIISFAPGEEVDRDTMESCQKAVLQSLGADGHQSFTAVHYDAEDNHTHMHVALNLINPETLEKLDIWHDYFKMSRAAEWCEVEHGLQLTNHGNWRDKLGVNDYKLDVQKLPDNEIDKGGRTRQISQRTIKGYNANASDPSKKVATTLAARDAYARTHYSWYDIAKENVVPSILKELKRPGVKWEDIQAVAKTQNMTFVKSGSGYKLVGPENGQHLKASELGLSAKELDKKLGPLPKPAVSELFRSRVDVVKLELRNATNWTQANEIAESHGVHIYDMGNNKGRFRDMRGDESLPLSTYKMTIPKLEERLGTYIPSPLTAKYQDQERERRGLGIERRAEFIQAKPNEVLDDIIKTRSTWERKDVESVVCQKLHLSKGDIPPEYSLAVRQTTDSILARCRDLNPLNNEEKKIYSTNEVMNEELLMLHAADELSNRTDAPTLRAPNKDLDAQQVAAYNHLATNKQFAIVTGIAGSGKSRLQRDLFAAYEEQGYTVVGIAVSGEAKRTLAEEAEIATETAAKLVYDIKKGIVTLDSKSIVCLDEASTIGTQDMRIILEEVCQSGATFRMLGDTQQHESVARGAVLSGLAKKHGAYDMEKTRRSHHALYQEVAVECRQGNAAKGIDKLVKNGDVFQHTTNEEAKDAAVRRFVEIQDETVVDKKGRRPRTALLLASTNKDMRSMNLMVQNALKEKGKLGAGKTYQTQDGKVEFCIGDTIVVRQSKTVKGREKWTNRDRATVLEHLPGGRLRLQRERDGLIDVWNPKDKNGIELGYAMTSYSSQGKTVDEVLLLAANGLRETYVDMTRAMDRIRIYYGKDVMHDIGAVMRAAQRDQKKSLVTDYFKPEELRALTKNLLDKDEKKRKLATMGVADEPIKQKLLSEMTPRERIEFAKLQEAEMQREQVHEVRKEKEREYGR